MAAQMDVVRVAAPGVRSELRGIGNPESESEGGGEKGPESTITRRSSVSFHYQEIEARDDTGLTAYRIVPLDSATSNVVPTSFRDEEWEQMEDAFGEREVMLISHKRGNETVYQHHLEDLWDRHGRPLMKNASGASGINEVREVLKSRTTGEPRTVFPVIGGHKITVFGCLGPPASGNTSEYRYRSVVTDPLFEYMFEEVQRAMWHDASARSRLKTGRNRFHLSAELCQGSSYLSGSD
ncbi:hypothetical protein HDU88_007124 [Geranomyces variabilis]|nr:hypothetical protein HDU88_007124 [Geranomyces variabilis]